MNEPIVLKQGLRVALVVALRAVFPALIAMGMLYGATVASDVDFDSSFVASTVIVGMLSLLLLRSPSESTGSLAVGRAAEVLHLLVRWGMLLGVMFAIGYATKSSGHFSRQAVLLWAILTPVPLAVSSLLLSELMRVLSFTASNARRAVIAGCNEASIELSRRLERATRARITSCGFFDDRGVDRLSGIGSGQLLGRLPELADYVKTNGIDIIFVALPMRHIQRVMDLLDDLRDTTASIYYLPDIFVFDLIQARTGDVMGMPVVAMCETPFYGYRAVTKRLTDVFVASTALFALAPIMVAIAALVRLSSPGPVMFRQRRYGLDGEEIIIYKFRTMTVVEDGGNVVQATREDQRVTPIGRILRRASLDELPQLINVLQGRMSLVGPRPHAVAHNEQYRKLIKGYMIRHKVLPGMTGLAQINGCRGETSQLEQMQARVQYDLDYLRRWSPALDLEILWRTFLMVFRSDDRAY